MRRGFLAFLGLSLLSIAWLFSTPPFQAPDESAHFLRALTIANGRLVGPRVPIDAAGEAMLRLGTWHAAEQRWIDHDRRGVFVPARLSPPAERCLDDAPDTGRGCLEVSYTGDYFPLAFGLPAIAIGASSRVPTALWLARIGSLIPVLLLLWLALAYSRGGARWARLGVLLAITPMVFFIGSVLNPSGLEIAAAIAFLAGLLALSRDPSSFSRAAWVGLVIAGLAMIWSWQLGPLYLALYLVLLASLLGGRRLRELLASQRSRVVPALAAFVVAVVLFVIYGFAYGVLHSSFSLSPFAASLRAGRDEYTLALRGAIGIFGSYNVPLSSPMTLLWLLVVAVLVGFALWWAGGRERVAIVLTAGFAVLFPIVFYGFSYRYSGFGLQGRYILPALTPIPIVAGFVLDRSRLAGVRGAASAWRVALLAIAGFQLAAWWVNAHHWSASSGVLLTHSQWSPPLGWWPWLLLAVCGALAVAASAFADVPWFGVAPASEPTPS